MAAVSDTARALDGSDDDDAKWAAEESTQLRARKAAWARVEADDAEIGEILASAVEGMHVESPERLRSGEEITTSAEALAIARVMAMEKATLEAEERAREEEREWEEEEKRLEAEERARKEERAARLAAENAAHAAEMEVVEATRLHVLEEMQLLEETEARVAVEEVAFQEEEERRATSGERRGEWATPPMSGETDDGERDKGETASLVCTARALRLSVALAFSAGPRKGVTPPTCACGPSTNTK